MKHSYILYRIIDGKIELFQSHKGWYSGLLLGDRHSAISEIGRITVFEGEHEHPVEQIVCGTYTSEDRIEHPKHLLSSPMLFTFKAASSVHAGILQNAVIPWVIKNQLFSGTVHFTDKRRTIAKNLSITPAPF